MHGTPVSIKQTSAAIHLFLFFIRSHSKANPSHRRSLCKPWTPTTSPSRAIRNTGNLLASSSLAWKAGSTSLARVLLAAKGNRNLLAGILGQHTALLAGYEFKGVLWNPILDLPQLHFVWVNSRPFFLIVFPWFRSSSLYIGVFRSQPLPTATVAVVAASGGEYGVPVMW